MKFYIHGDHTSPYGDFSYQKCDELEAALKQEWAAIQGFSFSSISGAEISISEKATAVMTVREVLALTKDALAAASIAVDWNIWTVIEA